MRTIDSYIALNRFGLGAGPGEADRIADDPRGWVRAQITAAAPPLAGSDAPGSEQILRDIHVARHSGSEELRATAGRYYRDAFRKGIARRMTVMLRSPVPFAERMTLFWSNHFTTSTTKRIIGPAIPAYEREAIRPHIFGRFSDMLRAVERHPVMLAYLDNVASAGENSRVGARRRRRSGAQKTVNENLAREILELHTLGVNGGYTQADVIALAHAISGWSFGGMRFRRDEAAVHGGFEFQARFHEPGPKTVLGKTYRQDGPDQGIAILDDLARHSSTAQHIATKLVRHFVADDPPEEAVSQITRTFVETDGDLAEVSRALIDLDAVWRDPMPKVKTPYELVIATHRAIGLPQIKGRDTARVLQQFGHLPFSALSPAGFGDRAQDWLAPEALMGRIEWLRRFAARASRDLVPSAVLEDTIGAVAAPETRDWVAQAPSGSEALAMLFASPEFQRR